jgi:hypothetical protein
VVGAIGMIVKVTTDEQFYVEHGSGGTLVILLARNSNVILVIWLSVLWYLTVGVICLRNSCILLRCYQYICDKHNSSMAIFHGNVPDGPSVNTICHSGESYENFY